MLIDPYGRKVKSIRISLTTKCNLKCFYCHNEGQEYSHEEMTPNEIGYILKIASSLGIKSVKFTGGEPLLRNDIVEIVEIASKYMEDVSITTNGTLLAPIAKKLKEDGLNRINISMDTIDRGKYKEITGYDLLENVINGIKKSIKAGLNPVKVNIVALFPLNETMETVKFVWKLNAIPQIIEPINFENSIDEIEDYIASRAIKIRERHMHRRKIYTLLFNGEEKDVEIVRPMHNSAFCSACTRIRLTSDGKLKPCLMHNDGLVDIITPIRNGAKEEEIVELIKKAVRNRRPYWR